MKISFLFVFYVVLFRPLGGLVGWQTHPTALLLNRSDCLKRNSTSISEVKIYSAVILSSAVTVGRNAHPMAFRI
ncbi:MAG: hypothetical protein IKZ88_06490 [Neisseriaceae bacterium]|nr:hypothetical protein [Neisseriaceae bacterium]